MPDSHRSDTVSTETQLLGVPESRDFRSYHDFLREARKYMEGPLVGELRDNFSAAADQAGLSEPDEGQATQLLDDQIQFHFYQWGYRHLQRFKYHRPDFGIFATVNAERDAVIAALDSAAENADDELRLDPSVKAPAYYTDVDFHQHTGGVWSDPLDGLAYEFGRRTTNASHMDPNMIYHMNFSQFPEGTYQKVLDWGTGHGAGIIEWAKAHPESECYGVDISAPCLKLAHVRAKEAGQTVYFSQQDIEHLDYEDNTFDLVFHTFMFHEIPPKHLKAALAELYRVLKPGGRFCGGEFHLTPNRPFENVLQKSHAWTNNESYAVAWYDFDMEKVAKDIGFSKVHIEPFQPIEKRRKANPNSAAVNYWQFYVLEK